MSYRIQIHNELTGQTSWITANEIKKLDGNLELAESYARELGRCNLNYFSYRVFTTAGRPASKLVVTGECTYLSIGS